MEESGLFYHHCVPLESVSFGIIKPDKIHAREDSLEWIGYYEWLAEQIGFYPLFLAFGLGYDNMVMTEYWSQFRRIVYKDSEKTIYRKKGEFDNKVIFSFSDLVSDGVFMDFDVWNWSILFASRSDTGKQTMRMLFKKSWSFNRWLRKSKDEPHSVQLVLPELDLSKALRIGVRNIQTKKKLEKMGFSGVEVYRMKVPR